MTVVNKLKLYYSFQYNGHKVYITEDFQAT